MTEAIRGKIEFRNDECSDIKVNIGKVSFDKKSLVENFRTLVEDIQQRKPAVFKGKFFKRVFLRTTMGPGYMLHLPFIEPGSAKYQLRNSN